LIGFLTIPVTYVLQFVALHYISAASAAILIGVEPLLIALMSFVVLGNRVGKSVWLSGVLAFAGVYCVFADQVSWHQDFRGYAMVLLSTIVVAFWVVLTKKALATYSPRFSTACVAVFGFLTFLPIIPWLSASPLSFPWAAWGWILLLALTSSVLGQLFWNMGLKRVESSKAGIFLVLEPIAGVLLAYFYLQEPAGVYLWLGLLLVALSIVVVTYPRKTKLN
jgi:drug/metabolite transporter (DMT)-like permease